ncbi:MAG: hypothetical protein WC505_04365 [Patescibacteria group bacterium]
MIVTPIISTVVLPVLLLDIWAEIYHRICFPLMRIPYVKRRDYIKITDRAKLPYLSLFQKLYCMYCGYANGVIHYWAKMGAETELYWCGIKHEKDRDLFPPKHQEAFSEYGDKNDFNQKYCQKN